MKDHKTEPISIDPDTYMTDRVKGQLSYYRSKSAYNQQRFKFFKLVTIILAVSIPFLSSMDWEYASILIGLMGVLIAVSEGVLGLYKFQDNWLEYRGTSENLKREKYLFQTKTSPYNLDDENKAFHLFVEKVESILGKESTNWKKIMSEEAEKK